MNGQGSASTSNGEPNGPKVFIENKLKSSLVHIYDATRISNEIKDLENKHQTLQGFKAKLIKDSNSNPAPALANMSKKIDDIQREINQKREEMRSAEAQVVMGFQDIMQFLMGHSQDTLQTAQDYMKEAFTKFGTSLTSGVQTQITEIRDHLVEVDNNKMNASEKASILETINAFKTSIIELQKKQVAAIKVAADDQNTKLTAQMDQRLQNVNAEALTAQVQQRVMDNLDGKFRQHLQQVEQAQKVHASAAQDVDGKVSEKIAQTVRDEVKNYLTPETLKSIISTLPEYQALQSLRPEAAPLPDTVKKIMADLQQEVSDLKAKSFATRALVNNLVERNLTPTEVLQAQQAAAVQHVEEMEKSVQLMHNNMKIMEVVLGTQLKQMEENNTAVSTSRKRPRVDDDLEMVDQQDENSNREVLRRLSEVEAAHQKLLDFILQWKDTVLDDNFPEKLSNAFKKIEEVLLNHQTFIAFLTDPFTTSKTLKAKETASISQLPSPQTTLHPAMLDAISLLVKQTAEEYSAPLKEKIKALEEKLNARQQ